MKHLLTSIVILLGLVAFAQPEQTVRGTLMDNESAAPIFGAQLFLKLKDSVVARALSDENGVFEFQPVPVGKYLLVIQAPNYSTYASPVEVNSGKQTVLELKLQEKFTEVEGVEIVAQKQGEVKNEMATVSAQQFSVEETERYAGSRGDPARMASNFAGVQGADDSRNDIVVRGNSPLGVVYKVEGIDIPNPNHFSIAGSTGGPVSIINNKSLANSDFFMSAFPAEYGNSLSGIFDLKMRNGNNKLHEFTGQFGFLGTEVMAEGPLSKKNSSSYMVMGRYSTLSLFQFMGIKIGTDAVPVYGDGAFKFNFMLKHGGQLALWGIGGKSQINILISEQKEYTTDLYGEGDRDQYFGTGMGVAGLTYKKSLNEKTFFTATLAHSVEEQHSHHDYLIRSLDTTYDNGTQHIAINVDSIYPLMGFRFLINKTSGMFSFNRKIGNKQVLKFGLNTDVYQFNMKDSVLNTANTAFITRWDYNGSGGVLIQPFVQWKLRITEKMDFTAGLHAQYYSFSNAISPIEPRLGWKWNLKNTQKVFAGAGMHAQMQPLYTYTYFKTTSTGERVYHNHNMGFSKSMHLAAGYEKQFKKGFQIRSEVYYQYLYNIPVTINPSSFSMINQGSGFSRFFPDSLKNTGTGVNYGIELTIQKFFDKSFYVLVTGSLYNSTYKGSDDIVRNTSFNGRYTGNILFGKEFHLGKKHTIGLGGKVTYAGGKRYGYVNLAATSTQREIIYSDSLFNERQFKDYFRADLKISWKLNAAKVTHEIGLDLVNVLNTRNILSLTYAPDLANPTKEPIAEKTQLGFLPIFYYRISFKLAGGKKE